jgi:hypothetical protein
MTESSRRAQGFRAAESTESNDILESVAKVLIRSFLLGAALLALWWCIFLVGGDRMYELHSRWFDLTRHEFDVINYCGMAFVKIGIFVLFLIPYVSIRMVLRGR